MQKSRSTKYDGLFIRDNCTIKKQRIKSLNVTLQYEHKFHSMLQINVFQPAYRAMRTSSDMPVSESFGTCSSRTTVALNDTLIFDKTTAYNIQPAAIKADGAN